MSTDSTQQLNAQISEEAAEWFVEFRLGEIDASVRRRFDAWVRTSPEHLRAYLEVAAIWSEGHALDATQRLDSATLMARVAAEANVVPLEGTRAEGRKPSGEKTPLELPKRRRFTWAVAASVTLLTVAAGLLGYRAVRSPTYATDAGEQRSLRLADGSTIELNSRSQLRVRFSESTRDVELLEGQALFRVAKDRARPFIVRSGEARVQAVGTQFDVYRKRSGTVVTVLEGRVAVSSEQRSSNPGRSEALDAGEQVVIAPRQTSRPVKANLAAATAWTRRQLVLESTPLIEVAEEFNRYSERRLIVEDTAARPLRVSGVFSTDPAFLIRFLSERGDVRIRETDSEIYIRHD